MVSKFFIVVFIITKRVLVKRENKYVDHFFTVTWRLDLKGIRLMNGIQIKLLYIPEHRIWRYDRCL